MSDPAVLPTGSSVAGGIEALSAARLFAGLSADGLELVASAVRLVELEAGTTLWQQGDDADGLYVIVTGEVAISSRLPGDREVKLAQLGPGETMGELSVLDGGVRTAGARTTAPTTMLVLGHRDFASLLSVSQPSALAVRRSIVATVAARLAGRHAALAAFLGEGTAREPPRARDVPIETTGAPPLTYLARLPFFVGFGEAEINSLLAQGGLLALPSHTVVVGEGELPAGLWITLCGAVERVIERGGQRIRVGLAGPGRTFGYPGVDERSASSATAMTRERTVLLALPAAKVTALAHGTDAFSHQFLQAVQRDLVLAVREAERPQARLAVTTHPDQVV
jgi:CRP-like cAMP-binding protein